QLLPIGAPGELYIGGAGLARGYLNRPELTAETFIAHPFSDEPEARLYRTGDLVRWLPDGNLAFLGRLDHQVKIRGFRIELGEIESQLLREPSVKEAVVLAREDRGGDKRLVAYVTAAEALDVTEETLIDSLRQRLTAVLPDYMVPSAFVVLEHLPLTPNGKVDRKALPKPTYSDTSKDCVLPRTALETELSVLWSDVLGVERISIQANFFSLGGDSIKAIQVASRGQKQGLPLTTKQLFQHQTIAELVQHLDIHAESVQIPQSSVKGVQSLLPIQHHFLSTQPVEASKHFNQAIRFELPKDTQEAALRSLLTALLQRHDALRLSFIQTGSQWQGRYVEVDEAILQQTLALFEHQGEPEAESHIQSIANQLHSSFDLAQAPLMRCLWVRNSVSGVQELIWVIHHLVVDGVSWRILLEDLQEGLQQHQSQENASIQLGSKTHSLQYWSERLEEYSATEACLSTLPYWQKTVQSPSINLLERSSIFMSTPGFERSINTAELSTHTFIQADSQVEQICLSSTRTEQLLQGIHDCYHTQINDILLAALVLAVGEWADVDSAMSKQGLCLDLEGHGREPLFEDVDLTQTLGWFTSVFPLHLPFSLVNDSENDHEQLVLEACIKEVKERLRAIPNKGMDYGILQRYQQARLPQKSSSQLVFNYLGVFEKGFAEDSGQALASNLLREHALGFNSYVVDGQWTLYIDFHPQQFAAEDIKTLASSYQQALEKVLDHCLQASGGYTPSDFPLLSLTQKQVDHLQTESPFLEDLYPSTAMQQGLLFHSSLDPENGQYETQLKFKLTDLDSHRFKESWDQLVAEHAIFRTAFATVEGQNQIQVVNAQVNFPWYQYDWRHFSADQQQQQLQNLLVQGHCFTPEQAPLMNVHLAQIGEKEYWFVWQHHHALLDGWCLPIVFKELMARYQALATQSVPILPAARPYKDYIAWLGCQDQSTAEHYWRTYLEGFSEPTQVQIGDQQASGASCSQEYHLTLSRELTQQLEHQAQQHQVSLNLWLQLGWGLLLSHYSGTQDIVFGSTRSGRPSSLPGVEDMLGLFINSLPIRLKLSSKMQLQAALSQLKQAQTDQEDFSFTPLVDVQRWSDVPAGRELFDSLMVFENYPVDDVLAEELVQGSSNGCSNSPLNDDRLRISEYQGVESTHYPLTLSASPGDSLNLKLMYREPRFNGDQARQLLQHLEVLLHGLAHSKVDAPLASITLLSAEEKQQQLVEWNDTQHDFPGELCIHQLVEAQAAQQPEATALVFNRESLSYGELNQRA
ncbi:condensation domain-containing protein, partial [Vibrio hepatarius]|uniref:condensation domain-containing protein n=1 Tax=Vibrio hepatarius TaxID=171383 RepID=UPI001C096BB9